MKTITLRTLICSLLLCANFQLLADIIHVGPTRTFKKPSAVVNVAKDGDTIAIDAGIYLRDVAAWRQNNLHFMGVGGLAHLKSEGRASQGKAIWVIKGNNNIVESIEFSGCSVPDQNGAGIRMEGTNLTVRNCFFHHNENGILAGNNEQSKILIEHCEFGYNGFGRGFTHNIYINHIDSFIARYNYFHHAKIGHQLKSRAHNTLFLYNRIMDEETGTSSRLIDIPNGGFALIMGNVLMQGPKAENSNLLGYGLEGLNNPGPHNCHVYNNTFVNQRHASVFVHLKDGAIGKIINNAFVGKGNVLNGTANDMHHNVMNEDPTVFRFMDFDNYNYNLLEGSSLIDKGVDRLLLPGHIKLDKQYVHPFTFEERLINGKVDIGAYEYQVSTTVSEQLDRNIKIYPNPVINNIFICLPEDIKFVSIIDQFGNVLPTKWNAENQLKMEDFSRGIYFVQFSIGEKLFHRKIVKL